MKAGCVIPSDGWDGETWDCICIAWPDTPEWHAIFSGLLTAPTRGRFWRDNGIPGSIKEVQEIAWQIWEVNRDMFPCGPDESCVCVVVDEGGAAWIDTDGDGVGDIPLTSDPRISSPTIPIPEAGGAGYACIIATGVVALVEDTRDTMLDMMDAGATFAEMLTAILGIIGLVVPPFAGAAALAALVAAFLELTPVVIAEELDQDFLDELRCIIFNTLNADAEVTPDEWEQVKLAIADNMDGFQEVVGWNLVDMMGNVGMQNAATSYEIEEAECDDCVDCPAVETGLATTWWYGGAQGTGYLPVDGRLLEVVGGISSGARWILSEDFRSHCGTGYWGFCIEFISMSIDGGGDCDMELTWVNGDKTQVLMSELVGNKYCIRAVAKLTYGVTDDQIITGEVRIIPCVDYQCPECE
jgi:hypothetical protein